MISCIAIDDEPLALDLVKAYINKTPGLNFLGAFEDAIDAVEFIKGNKIDLLFLDIQMPDLNGLQLFKNLEEKPMVIFTTAYGEFALQGFELNAIDYLLKPFTFSRFSKAATKAIQFHQFINQSSPEAGSFIFVKSGYDLLKIMLDEIEYIEGLDDYIKIHLSTNKIVVTLMPLKSILDKLPDQRFIRIHRSYIVPLHKVKGLRNKKLILNNIDLPIGDTYTEKVMKYLQ
jgi:two-component system LytT family response regulator